MPRPCSADVTDSGAIETAASWAEPCAQQARCADGSRSASAAARVRSGRTTALDGWAFIGVAGTWWAISRAARHASVAPAGYLGRGPVTRRRGRGPGTSTTEPTLTRTRVTRRKLSCLNAHLLRYWGGLGGCHELPHVLEGPGRPGTVRVRGPEVLSEPVDDLRAPNPQLLPSEVARSAPGAETCRWPLSPKR
jgi:hypothetical protein